MVFGNCLPTYLSNSKIQLGLVFIIAFGIFISLQRAPVLADPDSFYHTGLAAVLRDEGILREFPWTQSSLYQRIFIDHHLGYHLSLIPWLSVGNDLVGLKLATAFWAALTIVIIAWCLRRWRVPWWGGGVLLLLTASPLLFRLSLGKAPSLGVGVAVLGYYLIFSRKLGWLFWWAWFYAWLYSAWPLLLVLAITFVMIESLSVFGSGFIAWLKSALSAKNLKLIGVILLGSGAGLIINPYFPTNLAYLGQLFTMALTAYHKFLGIGAEWYPYNPFELVSNIALPLGVFMLLTIPAIFNFKKQTILTRTTWALAIIFIVYTLKARRQVEYLVPWLVMASGLMWRDLWPLIKQPELKTKLKTWLPDPLRSNFFAVFLIGYLTVLIPLGFWRGYQEANNGLRAGFPINKYQRVASWLKNNTPARSIVFQSDWSNFPVLWYNNLHNYYLTGLDQTFMYEYDHKKYWLWVAATGGERRQLYDIAKNTFQASYIMVDKGHTDMLIWLNRDKRFKKVYTDPEAVIYALD